jgi:hypothetical protein
VSRSIGNKDKLSNCHQAYVAKRAVVPRSLVTKIIPEVQSFTMHFYMRETPPNTAEFCVSDHAPYRKSAALALYALLKV